MKHNCQFLKEVEDQFQIWLQIHSFKSNNSDLGKNVKTRAGEMAQCVRQLLGK